MKKNEVEAKKAEITKIIKDVLQRIFGGSIPENVLTNLVKDINAVYIKPEDIQD